MRKNIRIRFNHSEVLCLRNCMKDELVQQQKEFKSKCAACLMAYEKLKRWCE